MNGLHVYLVSILGVLLALTIWIGRRHGILFSKQLEALFFLGGFIDWAGTMSGLYSSFPVAAPNPPQQDPRPPVVTIQPEERSFPVKLLSAPKPAGEAPVGSALAYAAPESGAPDGEIAIATSPFRRLDEWTAVYDISAHTVYLPDGTMLEAHSGRGDRLDNPRYVHEPMRGSTPPSVYELAFRERPFHGVRALRLKPIGGAKIFGRTGFLAHTYMLGPKGDSNGCVVFKDYNAFLQAFENGAVKRLVVVENLD